MPDDQQLLDYLKKVAADLYETRERLHKLESGEQEPIAVVGMGCRFPGGVAGPEQLWDLVAAGTDAIAEFPQDRGWDAVEELYDAGVPYARQGGFVYDAAEFDPGFFGISPREALAMDPQQRLLLEVCWEAVERAGIDPESLRGSATGVFAGASASGYGAGTELKAELGGHLPIGTAVSVLSGRVSYTLGLEGPAMTVDTACSSSLVALHLACQALRARECTLALAGGVALLATPEAFAEFARQQGLAADGRCKAFSSAADGIGWGEGAGMVLLERLSDARRHGHEVLAVIRGSAVNQDGASNGLTAPNGPSQQRVIAAALANARLSAADVDVVEAHGTGTALGDPIEAQALLATYGQDRDQPLWLGSVKSNIGHPQTAAGVAGLIKMVLALRHNELPATLHVEEPSSQVDWSAGAVRLLTESVPWPGGERVRRAGVSAFGVSGTNVHLIVEEAPALAIPDEHPSRAVPIVAGAAAWLVSGRDESGLAAQAGRLREFVLSRPELEVADIGWSLATTRSMFDHRAVVVGEDRTELAAGLAAVATDRPASRVVTGVAGGPGKTVFVFPGQGSQWIGMGRELLACSPVFAARMDECARALAPYLDVYEALSGELVAADVVQPVLWAIMVSLAAVWEAAGVVPDAVVGHSQGEIAAACVAGILSLDDGARVVALRSKALRALAGRGGMLSIAEPVAKVRERLVEWGERISVAAVNGPAATVVSGEPAALEELAAACVDVRTRLLPVDYASHNAQIDVLEAEILHALQGISPGEARIPLMSALSGDSLAGPEMDAAYWYASLREPVEFERAVTRLTQTGHRRFIECSAHPVLTTAIGDTVADTVAVGTLRRDDGGTSRLLTSLAEAHVRGITVDWTAVLEQGQPVELPTYAFARQRFWPRTVIQERPVTTQDSVAEEQFWAAVEDGDLRELAQTLDIEEQRPFHEVVPALASWKRRERDGSTVANWRYRIAWTLMPEPAAVVLSGSWLVLGGPAEMDITRQCLRALTDRGADVVLVSLGEHETDRITIAERITETLDTEPTGVVSLLALNPEPVTDFPEVSAGVAGSLGVVQALGDLGIAAPLWMVTQSAMTTAPGESPAHPVQAQVWGMGRVVGLEHPDRWGGLIDLPARWDERIAARLCAALADGTEDQIALRGNGILARRLVRATPAARERWTSRGTVLITGGTGAVGVHVGPWLAERETERVVLTSRSGPGAGEVATLAARIAGMGSGVDVLTCDVAQRSEVAGLLDRVARTGPALSAVMHAANSVELTRLEHTDVAGLGAALGAKATGAVWLDELTADVELDAFVLFSSIAATWGSNEHGAYAAGNAFLDALAVDRRARGLPGTSVAWGVWDTRDWAAVDALVEQKPGSVTPARLLRQGMKFLDPGRALTALGQVLSDDETFIAVADVEWERFAPVFTAARPRPLLAQISEAQQPHTTVPQDLVVDENELAARLAGSSAEQRERVLTELVRSNAAAVLGHDSITEVPANRAFREMGFDSLTAVELRNRVNAATGLQLSSTVVFDYPSPTVLAGQIGSLLGFSAAETPTAPAAASVRLDEPIAVVGMGCRFPGGVTDPEGLWELLADGADVISGFPADRGWDVEGLFDPDPDHQGTSYVSEGGFLQGVTGFDAGFFGISPREALAMDPQQRLLLEVSWEAVERAGIDASALRGSLTGVFAGAAPSGYANNATGLEGSEGHLITGNSPSVLSGRISYALGLEGPAVTVDTACSSSLVALHQACQALRAGECSMALAGGVMVMADPAEFVGFSRQRVLATDGRCKAFAAGADGMGMGEGAGMILLERLSDAQRAGHDILAVVRGSALNQDGASNGLTAPNGPSQQRVIRAALASARLSAEDVDVVEAHGTGTALGDPIEAQALLATYGQNRNQPLWLGSVKSNIGHAQQAAGVAGVIKMVMALRHNTLPATLHVDEPSTHVDWSTGAVRLLTEPVKWPAGERARRAGISAFGISGTNAHLIIEEAPTRECVHKFPDPVLIGAPVPWVLSARSNTALAGQRARLRDFVTSHAEVSPVDVGWSLATARSIFEHRAVALGADRDELLAGLSGDGLSGVAAAGRVGFVFAGQGSQRVGMGAGLYAASPVFAETFDRVCGVLEAGLGLPIADVVLGRVEPGDERADQTVFAQTGLFALQVAMCAVLEACGVRPAAVAGHSVGEIAAAHISGALSLADACQLVATRARLMQALPAGGAMAAIEATESEILEALQDVAGLDIAGVNGPESVVVSGDEAVVEEFVQLWKGRRVKRLRVSHAFHSARMDPMMSEFGRLAATLDYGVPRIPWAAALTGELVDECVAGYWAEQVRRPVRFADAVATLADQDISTFIEIGPDATLSAMGSAAVDAAFVPLLRKDITAENSVLTALSQVFVRGVDVDWSVLLHAGQRVQLPTYAFQHQRFWPEHTVAAVAEADSVFWAAVEDGTVRELLDVDDEQPFREVVPALASWRQRERQDLTVANWRYRISWAPVPDSTIAAMDGTWLLIVPAGHTDVNLERALAERGAETVVIRIEPGELDRATLAERLREHESNVRGVISLLAYDNAPDADFSIPAGSLGLIQALGDLGITAPLWMLTTGAVATGPGELLEHPAQAQLWGLGRVVGLEHPERWGGLIDLPSGWDERIAARTCAVLAGNAEDQVAVRSAGMFARRLVRAAQPAMSTEWVPRGSILVTGGTGAVGGHVGRWLAGRGAERVVLTSRAGAGADGVAAQVAELAGLGTAVEVVGCDISQRAEVAGLVRRIGDQLRAVIHSAGVGEGIAVEDFTAADLARVTAVKVAGGRWLDELTAELELDAFVVFSSISATWGSGLQPGYAAANAFLDALTENRRARGLAASSVAWGVWDGAGMGAGEASAHLRRYGIQPMDPKLAIQGLAQVIDAREGVVAVADVDWARFAPTFTLRRPSPLLETIPETRQEPAEQAAATDSALGDRLAGLPRIEQQRMLTDLVRAAAATVLGYPNADEVEPERAFKELGFDSLTAVELRDRLNTVTGLPLSATLTFDYPNPMVLAEYLRTEIIQDDQSGSIFAELGQLESALSAVANDSAVREDVTKRLRGMLSNWLETQSSTESAADIEFQSATPDEVFNFLDKELGSL